MIEICKQITIGTFWVLAALFELTILAAFIIEIMLKVINGLINDHQEDDE